MISSVAYNNHPFFRFKSEKFETSTSVSQTPVVSPMEEEEKESLNLFESRPQQLSCRWVSTGKIHPKMELQWNRIESHQDNVEL